MNENTIKITFPDGKSENLKKGTKISAILNKLGVPEKNIIGLYVNNKAQSLANTLEYNATVSPIMNNQKEGALIYRRSLCNVFSSAVYKHFPEKRMVVGHSIAHGYYYTFADGSEISNSEFETIRNEMALIIDQNLNIETFKIPYEEALEIFTKENLKTTSKQLKFFSPAVIKVNKIGDFVQRNFGPLVQSTGVLKVYELRKYGKGILLRFPKASVPDSVPEFIDEPKLFKIYEKYKAWGKQIAVTSSASLNDLVIKRKINEFIDISETFQEKNIADIADQIAESKKVKVVLIAGPSSSGKTTTSKKLALELRAIGYNTKVISLDCYYVDHSRTPRDENGDYDFECLEALDIQLLNDNLIDLFAGKEVIIPTYDFHTGTQSFDEKNKMKLEENEILIMEGIHGLNDKLTPKIPNELKFKIYLSALTQLNLDDMNRISTSDNRLIRRIVRDAQFRGKPAAGTIEMWPSVRKGEEKHIYPFHNNADAILNTALDYELAVLKVYAEPLLKCVNPSQKEYSEACRLLKFLENFDAISPTAVPAKSIIREFIGGSAFKY